MANNQETKSSRKIKNTPRDERTAKKIHEHLVNEEDKISDEDISNIKTDFTVNPEIPVKETNKPGTSSKDEATAEEKLENEKIRDNTEPDVESSWNILEE